MRVLGMCVLVAVAASPAMAVFVENFSYADGALTDVSGGLWLADGTPQTDIAVQNGELRLSSAAGMHVWAWTESLGETGDGLTATIMIKKGDVGDGSNFWYLYFGQNTTGDLGYWYGGNNNAKGRGANGAGAATMLTGGWDRLDAVVDFTGGTTKFYVNGALNFTATHSGKSALNIIEFERYQRALAGDYILFDNLVVPEPASLILLALGGLVLRRRRV